MLLHVPAVYLGPFQKNKKQKKNKRCNIFHIFHQLKPVTNHAHQYIVIPSGEIRVLVVELIQICDAHLLHIYVCIFNISKDELSMYNFVLSDSYDIRSTYIHKIDDT